MNRDLAIALLINLEGGYVNNPADPGGATKYGVTQRTLDRVRVLPQFQTEATEDEPAAPTLPAAVADLTSDQAAQVYSVTEWDVIEGDALPPTLAPLMLHAAVNMGEATAIVLLQAIVGVKQDGVMGPATVRGVQVWHSPYMIGQTLAEEYAAHMAVHYARLDAKLDQFELGWFRRLLRVIVASLTLAPGTV